MTSVTGLDLVIFLHQKENAYLDDWEWMETHPMGGSESSVLHLAREFRAQGFNVRVTNEIEDLNKKCDIFIATRTWQVFAHGLRPGRLNYLLCTDDTNQPSVAVLRQPATAAMVYRAIDGAILISRYQATRWMSELNLPAAKLFLSSNGIPSFRFHPDRERLRSRPRLAYYGSTPFRGLAQLMESWDAIRSVVPDSELHIFSSMRIYGIDDPVEFQQIYRRAEGMAGVHYHGAQGQAAIREIALSCRALAYPCVFPETSCITAMEAMAYGCAVVSNDLGAMPETAPGNPLVHFGNGWLERWQKEASVAIGDGRILHVSGRVDDLHFGGGNCRATGVGDNAFERRGY